MLRNQEVLSLQRAASMHRAAADIENIGDEGARKPVAADDEYLSDDKIRDDAVLSRATLAAFALEDDYGDDDQIADELSLMGFRADADFA